MVLRWQINSEITSHLAWSNFDLLKRKSMIGWWLLYELYNIDKFGRDVQEDEDYYNKLKIVLICYNWKTCYCLLISEMLHAF